jgi:hypothetical protein
MTFKELFWTPQTRKGARWILGSLVCVALACGGSALAQNNDPHTIMERQVQSWCVKPKDDSLLNRGVDPCDITHFRKITSGDIHYLSPDPTSASASGDWTQHCPTFTGLPSYVTVEVLNTKTLEADDVDQVDPTQPICEADFLLKRG